MPYKDPQKRNEYHRNYTKKHPERYKGREKYQKEYKLKNKQKLMEKYDKEKQKWQRIKMRYGLTQEQWEQMYKDQDGKCYICNCISDKTLHVDHCHTTGKIRGLLCCFCNRTLTGFFKENAEIVFRTYIYLTKEKCYGVVPNV